MTTANPILADIEAKYGAFPDGEPAPDQSADEIAAETAPIITETVADEPAPEAQTQKAQSAGEVVPAPAAPGIDEIVAKAVAAAVAAVSARQPEAPPSQAPSPPAPAFSLEAFLANPAATMRQHSVPMEHVARSMVAAQYEAQGQRPPFEMTQPTVYPQIAALQAQNQAMLSAFTEMQAESRYDKYVAGVGPDLDVANADAYPNLAAARATNRAGVMARINARLPARAQFSDPKFVAPKYADVLKAVETDLADAAALLGSVPKVPPVKKPVATPSALRGSPPVTPSNSVADAERQIRDDVLRRYQ